MTMKIKNKNLEEIIYDNDDKDIFNFIIKFSQRHFYSDYSFDSLDSNLKLAKKLHEIFKNDEDFIEHVSRHPDGVSLRKVNRFYKNNHNKNLLKLMIREVNSYDANIGFFNVVTLMGVGSFIGGIFSVCDGFNGYITGGELFAIVLGFIGIILGTILIIYFTSFKYNKKEYIRRNG